jgi:hypothetical protein
MRWTQGETALRFFLFCRCFIHKSTTQFLTRTKMLSADVNLRSIWQRWKEKR